MNYSKDVANQANYLVLAGRYLLHTAAGLTSPASSTSPQAAYRRFGGFVFSTHESQTLVETLFVKSKAVWLGPVENQRELITAAAR